MAKPTKSDRDAVTIRLSQDSLRQLDQWRREHGAGTRSRAIRQLVEQALAAGPARRSVPAKVRAEAAALAEREIDRLADPSTDADEQAKRKRLLVKGPPELRRRRRDASE